MKQRSSSYSPLRQIMSPDLKARSRMPGSFSYGLRNASRWSSLKLSKISNRLSRCHNSHGGIFSLTGWVDKPPSQSCVAVDVNRVYPLIPTRASLECRPRIEEVLGWRLGHSPHEGFGFQ